jgi:hypothetical protein
MLTLAACKSTSGFVVMLQNTPVFFKSREHIFTAKLSTESELIAASDRITNIQLLLFIFDCLVEGTCLTSDPSLKLLRKN